MRTTAVGIAAVCAVAAALLPGPAASATPPPPDLSILTHNVAMLPTILGGKANGTRAHLFAEADHLRGHDVVVLEEAFDNGPSDTLKSRLASQYPHQTPVLGRSRSGWDETLGSYSSLTPEDGGVTILSRWPITHRVQYVYADGCGADWFANKGFVYARLDVAGRPVHVVGTHVQAEDSACFGNGAEVRAAQFAELDGFLGGLAIPADEPIVITGDLNVVKESPEYATMLTALDATAPAFAGHPYSWDPETNPLASSGGREQLDYVLFRRGHPQPRGWTNTTLTPMSPPWAHNGTTYTDYSDHYPVLGGTS